MIFPSRRKPLALLFCYGLTSALIGGFATETLAQASLRVDPTLLGLPPATATERPAPAAKAPADEVLVPAVETTPVEPAVVETRPMARERTETVERAAPPSVPVEEVKVAVPANPVAPARVDAAPEARGNERPARVPAAEKPASDIGTEPVVRAAEVKPRVVPAPAAPMTAAGGERRVSVSTLGPLRVDPALLGAPAAPAAAPVAVARTQARIVPGTTSAAVSVERPNEAGRGRPLPAAGLPPVAPPLGARDEEDGMDASGALSLRMAKRMEALPRKGQDPLPAFLAAGRMEGRVERELLAEEDVELRRAGTVLNADRVTYWPVDDEVQAEGNVRFEQGGDRISGPKMRLKMEEQVGFFEQPSYLLQREPTAGSTAAENKAQASAFLAAHANDTWNSGFASPKVLDIKPGQTTFKEPKVRLMPTVRGDAERIDFEGENQVRLTNGTYTTCSPGNDDWYARAQDIKLDFDNEVGEARDGTVVFKGVPIVYAPWLSFSLNNERKSGILAPKFGTSSDNGVELSVPYYWNIAPNMDATIEPRVMTRRGVQLLNEFRYLNAAYGDLYRGEAHVEFLPGDRLRDGDNRYGFSLRHEQKTASGFAASINYNRVSDDYYYTDLSSDIASTSQTQLLQQGVLTYSGGGWWTTTANFQQYQTLQPDADNPVREPYRLLPQITLNARKPDFYSTDVSFVGQFTRFTRPTQWMSGVRYGGDSGNRTVVYPQIAFPYVTPGWYVTPKIGVNARHYALSGQASDIPSSQSVTLPIASIDAGMTFERTSQWFGRDYLQTLEPRLYYVYIPYRDQSQIPIYDSGLADFNFAQIFSENQFSGWDRINNANQLTAAVTSRLLEPETGAEIVRAMFGQRLYFAKNRVGLTSVVDADEKWDRSDILAAFSGQILPRVYADGAWQYNLADRQLKRYSMGLRYQPEPGKVLNAAYRYNRDASAPIDQIDLSGQWPIDGRWHAVGRVNFSFKDDGVNLSTQSGGGRVIEAIAGVEYNGGCWAARAVVHRTALTQDDKSTAFFFQLELNDFSRIGSNPLSLLKRDIPGYGLINQPEAQSVLGD